MAKLFNERTDIIFQNPSYPKEFFKGRVESYWILIPMCAYKVLVPFPKEKNLNLFQETILKLFSSGVKKSEWIADTLALNLSLVDYIIDELKQHELLSSRGIITGKGLRLLNDEDDSYELTTGYVFYNYLTRNFADTFIPDRKFNVVSVKSRKRDSVDFYIDESVANPIYKRATILHVEDEEKIVEPTPPDILKICKKHKRRNQQILSRKMNDKDQEISYLPHNIEKVKLIGEKKAVYVASYMFLPYDDLMNKSNVQVCYPFDGGISPSILDSINRIIGMPENKTLKDGIQTVKEKVFDLSEEELKRVKADNAQVDKEIIKVLSKNIEKYPSIYKKIIDVESKYVKVQAIVNHNSGKNHDVIQKSIKEYIVENYNLISELLIEIAQANDYFNEDKVTYFNNQNIEILSTFARQCGFTDEDDNFKRLFSLKKGQIKGAYENQTVKGLIAYNLIIASAYNEHPFYKLAKIVPQFITYISKLIDLRNDCDHGNDTEYNFNMVAAYSIKNMYICSILLDNLTFKNNRQFDFNSDRIISKNQIKVRKQAELYIEKNYAELLNHYGSIKRLLIALQEEKILNGNDYPSKASEVYEAILKVLCENRLREDVVASLRDIRELKGKYTNIFKEKGFHIDEAPYYNLNKVKSVFRNYHNGTLISLFYAWFLSELKADEGILEEIANKVPELIKYLDDVRELRGHNNKVEFDNKKLKYITENFDNSVIGLLEVMNKHKIY